MQTQKTRVVDGTAAAKDNSKSPLSVKPKSWIRAARWIRDNHSARLVHRPTGNLVSQQKTRYYIELYDRCQELQEIGVEFEREQPYFPECKKVVRSDCVLVDMQTANMLVTVYDALGEANRKLFDDLDIVIAVNLGWKCVK